MYGSVIVFGCQDIQGPPGNRATVLLSPSGSVRYLVVCIITVPGMVPGTLEW